jgi:aspartyl-tRNA synthetase
MKRFNISDIPKHVGQEIKISGFVSTIRDQSKIKFILIRDITGTVQVVAIKQSNPDDFLLIKNLTHESVIEVIGLVKEEKQAPGGFEIELKKVKILSLSNPNLPIPIKTNKDQVEVEVDIAHRLDWRWIDLRSVQNQTTFKVLTKLESALYNYFINNDFIEIHSPKLMGSASESGSEVFEVKYFDRKAYLAQSPQFYKQMAISSGFEKVFEIGPVFRAEKSFTSRHSTEFTGVDIEIAYIDSCEDIMKEEEKMLSFAIQEVKNSYNKDVKDIFNREIITPVLPFPRLKLKEAKEILSKLDIPSEKDNDLSPAEERAISSYIKDKFNHEFLFITEYPVSARPFYHMHNEKDNSLTQSFDLLWNGLEITTGAQREHRYDLLSQQLIEKGIQPKSLQFYLNFFKYGCPPHGGLGLGLNRVLMQLLGLENIRDAELIYRGVNRLDP